MSSVGAQHRGRPFDRSANANDIGLTEAHATRVGMIAFLISEVAFFSTLIVAYLMFLGQSETGPTPAEVLGLGLAAINTALLLSSSAMLWLSSRALAWGHLARMRLTLALTIVLGLLFLVGTGYEWYELIWKHGLTISTNLFGTTYFTLIGCHAVHVSMGLLCMTLLFCLSLSERFVHRTAGAFELVEWYWHFVDGVWIALFLIVYVLGR
jgi:cytochrome c oxidase subunit 3/cytochrome o ubiquinol oxidase subunit 3